MRIDISKEQFGALYTLAEELKAEGRDHILYDILDSKVDAILRREQYMDAFIREGVSSEARSKARLQYLQDRGIL